MLIINVFYATKGGSKYENYGELSIKSTPNIGEKIGLTINNKDLIFEIVEVIYSSNSHSNVADVFAKEIDSIANYYALLNRRIF